MIPAVGDRIRLAAPMVDEPDPIPVGTEGTVDWVNPVRNFGPPFTQIGVAWDNGRALMLCVPPDRCEVIR